VATGESVKAFTLPTDIEYGLYGMNSLGVSDDETHLAFGTSGVEGFGGLVIWNVSENQLASGSYPAGLARVAFSPHRTLVGSTSFDNAVVLWDPATATPQHLLVSENRGIYPFAWSPDGQTLAAGDGQGQLLLWETPSNR
jgi:WD40 repeat protein